MLKHLVVLCETYPKFNIPTFKSGNLIKSGKNALVQGTRKSEERSLLNVSEYRRIKCNAEIEHLIQTVGMELTMLYSKKRWKVQAYDSEEVGKIAKDFGLHPMIAKILAIRGINTKDSIYRFFNIDEALFFDPYQFNDMKKTVERIKLAIFKNEKILIYGDYDADGVTSTALLYKTLAKLGADCSFYIPNRFTEGYGINNEAIGRAHTNDVKVIITVDTGISAVEGAELAKNLGISLIVTDHHEPQAILPDAYAILNPKKPGEAYPFKNLAGVGVAFKLAHALLGKIPKEYMDLVAIGTIADLVPLMDENRVIATLGLKQMQTTSNIGIQSLLDEANLKDKKLSTYHIGFIIGPRINAIGRLESSHNAVQLLITEDKEEARKITKELDNINRERQLLVKKTTEEAIQIIQEQNMVNDKVLVVVKENWNVGVIGIVASHVLKNYYKPTIILSIDTETKIAKGSCRSIDGYNIYNALTEVKHLLINYGGHPAAAGLSINEENVSLLREGLNGLADEWLNDEDFIPYENVDVACTLEDIDLNLIQQIEKLGPFGIGNPHPIVLIDEVAVTSTIALGNQNQHLKINVKNNEKNIEAIYFNNGNFAKEIASLSNIQLLGELNINEWKGKKKPQVIIRDMKIDNIQIFDWRGSYNNNLSDLRKIPYMDVALLYIDEVENKINGDKWNYIPYKDWKNIKKYDIKSIVLIHLPPSIQLLKELLISVPNLERIYCIFEIQNKDMTKININRDLFKKVYIALLKNDSLRNVTSIENYFKKNNFNSELCKFILEVFEELELITRNNDKIEIKSNSEKTDLIHSTIYQNYLEEEEIKKIFLYSNMNKLKEWFLNQYYNK